MIVQHRTILNTATALVLAASLTAAPLVDAFAAGDATSRSATVQSQSTTSVSIADYPWTGGDDLNDAIREEVAVAKIPGYNAVIDFLDGYAVSIDDFLAIDADELKALDDDFAEFATFIVDVQAELKELVDNEDVDPTPSPTPNDNSTEVNPSDSNSNGDTAAEETVVEDAPEDMVAEKTELEEDEIVYVSRNLTTEQFIDTIGEDARELAQDNDLYASVMLAQAIVESASGSSGLSCEPYNNLFGIKGSYKGSSVRMKTQEDDGEGNLETIVAEFRKYPSLRDSLSDYVDLLTGNSLYTPVKKSNCETYEDACEYLQGRYATSTTYARTLKAYIEAYDLTQYDNPADSSSTKLEKVSGSPSLTTVSTHQGALASDTTDLGVVVPDEGLPESSSISPLAAGILASGAVLLAGAVGFYIYWKRRVQKECAVVGKHGSETDEGSGEESGMKAALRAMLKPSNVDGDQNAVEGKHAAATVGKGAASAKARHAAAPAAEDENADE